MEWNVDFEREQPIYQQLREQILLAIADGTLPPGSQLPSVRKLGETLGVNMHTVNKAYLLLRDEGFLTLDRRSGARVCANLPRPDGNTERLLAEKLLPLAAEARCRGIGRKEFRRVAGDVYETLKNEKKG